MGNWQNPHNYRPRDWNAVQAFRKRIQAAVDRLAMEPVARMESTVDDFRDSPGPRHVVEWPGGYATLIDYEQAGLPIDELKNMTDADIDACLSVLVEVD